MTRELKWYMRKYLFNAKEGNNGEREEQKKTSHILKQPVDVNTTLSVITLNINELNNPIKRKRSAD